MNKANRGASNAVPLPNRNSINNGRPSSVRSKSVDHGRLRRQQNNHAQKSHIERSSLEEYGYIFDQSRLVSIENGQPFEFFVYENDEENHKRYHSIGRLVDDYVYHLLESDCQLRRISIPVDPKRGEPTGFFFASDNVFTADPLMIIIHGMGVVRAGQWSRKLIMNVNLTVGSQIDYIRRARNKGYAVIVTNTNLNTDESSRSINSRSRAIRGSESAEEHACYIWENFVRTGSARHICLMAHSYGGAVVLELASRYLRDFDRWVFAVALSDSPMKAYTKHCDRNVLKILQKKTINWIADTKPVDTRLNTRDYGEIRSAGHTEHAWTSYTAFDAVFKFFDAQRAKLERLSF